MKLKNPMQKPKPQKPVERKPRKVDADYLHRAALYYLQRYAATRVRLREVLLRKVARRQLLKTVQATEVQIWIPEIEKLLDRYEASGLLNDQALAETRVVNMRAAGRSARDITNKLRQKGFAPAMIENTLQENADDGGITDVEAIQKFMQKKKLGPFRRNDKVMDEKTVQKEIGTLLRAGFNYQLVRDALSMQQAAEIDLCEDP
ncbi:MAG TPA: RecX family transcriptional regulator [Alphaproteobacteria bacterium]|nr:RecX family transcriptional regulator [Alphaproteobacteria bacterium]